MKKRHLRDTPNNRYIGGTVTEEELKALSSTVTNLARDLEAACITLRYAVQNKLFELSQPSPMDIKARIEASRFYGEQKGKAEAGERTASAINNSFRNL